jgi:carbon-monoxide dehydrogenase large subunit
VGSIPTFTAAIVDAFAHKGVTHLDMPHSAFRVWKSLKQHGLNL